ncbi:MAG TPA: alpha/beta fold hydrolase [Myxococcota bacterium]
MAATLLLALAFAATSPTAHSFDSAGTQLRYLEAGTGDAVILLHGLDASAELNWVRPGIFDDVAAHHRAIALDLRGHGESDQPVDDASYGEPYVDDVVRLMDHLGIERARIVGYSLGGMIAMKLAVEHPERVVDVTLGGMGWVKDGSPEAQRFGRAASDGLFALLRLAPAAAARGLRRLGVTEAQVKALALPVTMIVGDRDPTKRLFVDPLHAARPDFPVVVIPGAGHLSCVGKPAFKAAIAALLAASPK